MKKLNYLLPTLFAAFLCTAPIQAQSGLGGTGGIGTTTGGGFGSGGAGGIGSGGIGTASGGLGGSFSGGGTQFSGGAGFQGVQIQPLMKTMSGTAVPAGNVSTSNPFRDSYANPLAAGLPQGMTPQAFGSPVYGTTATTGTGLGIGGQGTTTTTSPAGAIPGQVGGLAPNTTGVGTGATGIGTSTASTTGFSTLGQNRNPVYTTVPGYGVPIVPRTPVKLQSTVRTLITGHPLLPSHQRIQISMAGPVVVLRGTVADPRESRLAANMIRLTPGVRGVRNELTVSAKR